MSKRAVTFRSRSKHGPRIAAPKWQRRIIGREMKLINKHSGELIDAALHKIGGPIALPGPPRWSDEQMKKVRDLIGIGIAGPITCDYV